MSQIRHFTDLIKDLTSATQQTWISSSTASLAAFASLGNPEQSIAAYFDAMPPEQRLALFDGSHDTSTHFKWLAHRNATPRFAVWLHEYKEATARSAGYAQVPHDHRYNIASLIMSGGYIAATWIKSTNSLIETGRKIYRRDDVMVLTHEEIHSLVQIEPDTLTLVVEGPPLKGFSSAYYAGEDEPRKFPDFPTRWPELRLKLWR